MYIILFFEVPGLIFPQVTLERTWVSALSLYIWTSRVCSGGGGGGVEAGGDDGGNDDGGGSISGSDGCITIPEVPSLSVDWSIPTTEELPRSSRDMVKIETTMKDLLSDMAYSLIWLKISIHELV
jgi:hypothetical protein